MLCRFSVKPMLFPHSLVRLVRCPLALRERMFLLVLSVFVHLLLKPQAHWRPATVNFDQFVEHDVLEIKVKR